MTETKSNNRQTRIGLGNKSGRTEASGTAAGNDGVVRQSFSHGRSRAVAVEVKKQRRGLRTGIGGARVAEKPSPTGKEQGKRTTSPSQTSRSGGRSGENRGRKGTIDRGLTDEENSTRIRVLLEAKKQEEEARKRAAEEAKVQAELEARRAKEEEARLEQEALEQKAAAEEEARRKAEEAENAPAEFEASTSGKAPAKPAPRKSSKAKSEETTLELDRDALAAASAAAAAASPEARELARPTRSTASKSRDDSDDRGGKAGKRGASRASDNAPKSRSGRNEGRSRQFQIDLDEGEIVERRERSLASLKRRREKNKSSVSSREQNIVREVILPDTITVAELANRMAVRAGAVIKSLMKMGVMATVNETIDAETAEIVVSEMGHTTKRVSASDVEIGLEEPKDEANALKSRAPVVTVMGHVDHGKTSLLDALRSTDVAGREAGGITQHIGAYQVDPGNGELITFIDTPGHAAFSEMRARGAKVTDLVILVVAADDGVMPQTVEAIRHAKAAEVPIILAINKMDKPEADPSRVKQELLGHEIITEEFGGEVLAVEVSALARTGLKELLETIQLQAELLELKANPDRNAHGIIIEAKLERGRGAVATVLISSGTIRVGEIVVCGDNWGRVRALMDYRGKPVKTAGPSVPVEVLGLDGVPSAGDQLVTVENERRAREITQYRVEKAREMASVTGAKKSLEDMFSQIKTGELNELGVIVKADVHGSLEAIQAGLTNLSTDEVKVRLLHGAVGAITESDITLAAASSALVVGFNVRAGAQARDLAKRDGIDIRYYSIIYELLDDAKSILTGMLVPDEREVIIGHAEIREVFSASKIGRIAGCRVTDGMVRRGSRVRLLRDDVVIHEGELSSLRRFKDDAKEVREGFECGISLASYNDIKVGDVIESYEMQEFAREL